MYMKTQADIRNAEHGTRNQENAGEAGRESKEGDKRPANDDTG